MEDNNKLVEVEPIEDTPFHCVKTNDQYFLALGKFKVSDLHADHVEIKELAYSPNWNTLLQVIYAVARSLQDEPLVQKTEEK
jgi:hypothetical protein